MFKFNEDFWAKIRKAETSKVIKYEQHKGVYTVHYIDQAGGPWLFFDNTHTGRFCGLWHTVFFTTFGFIPLFCREVCYKVVVPVPTVVDALSLYNIFNDVKASNNGQNWSGKIGADFRDYTPSRFSMFFYCNGFEHGLKRYEQVVAVLRDCELHELADKTILKKGCTEMERDFPDSSTWTKTAAERNWNAEEGRLAQIINDPMENHSQPDFVVARILYEWQKWAGETFDPTYERCFGKNLLHVHAKTYHNTKQQEPQ